MLSLLFPALNKLDSGGLPVWLNHDSPWEIFSEHEENLMSQIIKLTGSTDSSFIHPSAKIGKYVEIENPCFIGENVTIRHSALLRRGSWICDGSVIGHSSEIKNSILLPGSNAPHFNYVGDSIIGTGVNLGAGVIISNVRNDRRSILLTDQNGIRINSGLRKLGALIGDGAQIGCNTVSNPGTIVCPNVMISPNSTLGGWIANQE